MMHVLWYYCTKLYIQLWYIHSYLLDYDVQSNILDYILDEIKWD